MQHYYSFFASAKLKFPLKLAKDMDMANFWNILLNPSTRTHYRAVLLNGLEEAMNKVFRTIHLISQGLKLESPVKTKINQKIWASGQSSALTNLMGSSLSRDTFSLFLAVAWLYLQGILPESFSFWEQGQTLLSFVGFV